jgi:copper ion binding protein
MTEQAFKVKGMTCSHCSARVEKAVGGIAGVEKAVADLNAKKLTVTFDESKVTVGDLKAAVTDAGYKFKGK